MRARDLTETDDGGAEEFERRYRTVSSRDARFDGWFFTGVTSTGIYCRPSCPAMTPKRQNVRFYPTAAAAQRAGFRACLRCRPDASPGSPEWNGRADVVARAMRYIADGTVDREGVGGVAARLGYGERQLHRLLVAELGTGALALARAQRAQTARVLIETTDLPMSAVAFAAGFASIRQFNDTVRSVFATTPGGLRRRRRPGTAPGPGDAGVVSVRLPFRRPLADGPLFDFLAGRAVRGIEAASGRRYRRTLALPHGDGVLDLSPDGDAIRANLALADQRDLATAVNRCRRLLDLDADPVAVDALLGEDPLLALGVARHPGLRLPGAADGAELAVRAVIGQQVSVAGARRLLARLVELAGRPLAVPDGELTHVFPGPEELAACSPEALPLPVTRRRALLAVAQALATGDVSLDPGADPVETSHRLEALPGIGPWTTSYIAMRATGDPDAFLPSDLGVRRALRRLGGPEEPGALAGRAERWRPWRAYAVMHLWTSLAEPVPEVSAHPTTDLDPSTEQAGPHRRRRPRGPRAA